MNILPADDPRHGTRRGYYAHRRAGSPACQPCKRAAAAAEARYQMLRAQGIQSRLDPTGTQRRLRALVALGYTWRAIDQQLGLYNMAEKWGNGRLNYVFPRTAVKVTDVYDRLSMTLPPNQTSRERAAISKARNLARRRGWAPPLAWDDATIDDPAAKPVGAGYVPTDRRELLAELDHRHAGVSEACATLKLRRDSLEKWCARHGLADLYSRMVRREQPDYERLATGKKAS